MLCANTHRNLHSFPTRRSSDLNEEKIDKTQSITVEVSDFEEYRINLAVRAFTKREDYWDVYYKLHKKTIELRSEEHTSELQSRGHIVCRLLLEKKKSIITVTYL